MAYAKKSVSLPQKMFDAALARAKRMGYETFSEYVQYLVKRDLEERPAHSVVREEPAEPSEVEAIGNEPGESAAEDGGTGPKKIGFKKRASPVKFHKTYALDKRSRMPPRDAVEPKDLAVSG